MDWSSEGVILTVRRHGETSAILDVFTPDKGRHAGVVRGGASRKMTPILQPGAQVAVEWRARLEEHLGAFRVEPISARASILNDRLALAGLSSVCAVSSFAFPERMPLIHLYTRTTDLLDRMASARPYLAAYAHWERTVLEDMGYGLDFSACSATGGQDDLIYVSPKTGRSVSKSGAGVWADRLLPLPSFLRDEDDTSDANEILDALRTTGHFLHSWLAPALGNRPLPEARTRFVTALQKMATSA